jgi:hypothetical protein
MGCDEETNPRAAIPLNFDADEEPLPLVEFASGAADGNDAKIVEVSRVGTVSTGTFKEAAATDKSVQ